MRDYAEIEALIAEARRLRSEAVGNYLAAAWHGLGRGLSALGGLLTHKAKPKGRNASTPCLPA